MQKFDYKRFSKKKIKEITGYNFVGYSKGLFFYSNNMKEIFPCNKYIIVTYNRLDKHGELYILAHEIGHVIHWQNLYKKNKKLFYRSFKSLEDGPIENYKLEVGATLEAQKLLKNLGIKIDKEKAYHYWIGSFKHYSSKLFNGKHPKGLAKPDTIAKKMGLI